MDCIPPWLSSRNQCSTNIKTYNYTKWEIGSMISASFKKPIDEWKPTEMEKKCKNPCKKMTNKVSLKVDKNRNFTFASIKFRFKKTVRVEKKVVVYTWFNFIIDVGSSLGLWLGLSALSITDLVIEAFMMAKKRSLVKQIFET